MRSRMVAVGNVRLHTVELGGSGSARGSVVIVHGMVVASSGTMPLAAALARRGFVVHVPDLPGFGRSDRTPHALDVDLSAEALCGFLEESGTGGAALVGNSYGTQVAAAAVAAGARVSRLALLSPTIDPRLRRRVTHLLPGGRPGPLRPRRSGRLGHLVRDRLLPPSAAESRPRLLSLVVREYAAAGPARVLSTYRHAVRDDIALRMPHIGVPVLVARGSEDRLSTTEWARSLAEAAPRGRYVELPGVDHDGQYEAADDVAEALAGFLAGDGAQPSSYSTPQRPETSAANLSSSAGSRGSGNG